MKYTFEKFQIQLVSRPNPSSNPACIKNNKHSHALHNNISSKIRNVSTAEFSHRKNPEKDNDFLRKSFQQ